MYEHQNSSVTDPFESIINVAVVNFHAFWGRKERNLSRIVGYIHAAARRGADIVVLPEMALTGYENQADVPYAEKMQVLQAEPVPGPAVDAVARATREAGVYAVFGMPELASEDRSIVYNTAVACGPEGYIGRYRKLHPANDENAWCKKGSDPFWIDTRWGPIGIGICYDTYSFPELMRFHAARGARLYINSTAMMRAFSGFDWLGCYYDTMKHGVVANDIFIASSNLVGPDIINEYFSNEIAEKTVARATTFAGSSMILGPGFDKKVAVYAGGTDKFEGELFMATLDLSLASRMIFNINPSADSPDFRPDIYLKMSKMLLEDSYWQRHAEKDSAQ